MRKTKGGEGELEKLATPPTASLISSVRIMVLAIVTAGTAHGIVNGHERREGRREQPAAAVPADAETPAARIDAVKVALDAVGAAAAAGTGRAEKAGGGRGGGEDGLLDLAVLLDELARDDAEDLLDALAALGADLVARVPADLLPPEPAAPFATRAARFGRARWRRPRS